MNYLKKTIIIIPIIIALIVILSINKKSSIVKITAITNTGLTEGYGIVYKVDKQTFIITNNHVIENNHKILVNNKYKAKVINYDIYEDIAILSIQNTKFKPAKFNRRLKKQDKISIINLDNHKKNSGIITKLNEKILVTLKNGNYLLNCIELKAPITQGHSGSPLYNTKKQVIGIITMKHKTKNNIGYAIDINHALKIANKLMNHSIKRPNLKVKLASTSNTNIIKKYHLNTSNIQGVIVVQNNGSNKLKQGDIITSINNIKVNDIAHFKYYLYNSNKIVLKVYRNNQYQTVIINS